MGIFDFFPAYLSVLRLSDLIRQKHEDAIPFESRMRMAKVAVLKMEYAEKDFDRVADHALKVFQIIHPN